jgi:argininosuccinate synthase
MPFTLLLHYDEYHTPIHELAAALPGVEVVLLRVELGHTVERAAASELELPPGWRLVDVDGRREFYDDYLVRAIKANARYQGNYYLSAALSRPVLATICTRHAGAGCERIIHGLAGNDQLRFEMGVFSLCPDTPISSVAQLLGSRSRANADSYTISDNLWGCSYEAAELSDPAVPPTSLGRLAAGLGGPPERHVLELAQGRPVALDGEALAGLELVERVAALGRRFSVGVCDLVEDGYLGLKSRAIYLHPAAHVLVTAHEDLERLVCSRLQNAHKQLVDRAWSELVYQGYWFDPQRESLEAYIDSINALVTGTVTLELSPGVVRVVARQSPNALYDASHAIYKMGQDLGLHAVTEISRLWSCTMQAAVRRRSSR